jgi:DDE superfamily endonuclease
MAVRTSAPVGKTPILRVPLTRDHLSALGALTPQGRLFMPVQDHSYQGEEVVRFLKRLLTKIPGKLLIIWDGSPYSSLSGGQRFPGGRRSSPHPPGASACLCARTQPAGRGLEFAQTPRTGSNRCCKDLLQLDSELLLARARLRHRKHALRQCFAHAGYSL